MPIVLGLDTATAYTAVAVTRAGEVVDEQSAAPGGEGRPRHAVDLLPLAERAAEAVGGWDAVERIAVGVGPGSFTGVRIGVATARALAQTLDLEIVAVSSLAALGAGIAERAGERPALAAIDARRQEAFVSLSEGGRELWPPLLIDAPELGRRLAELDGAPLAAGDGALRFRHELETAGAEVPPDADPVHRLAARHVCWLGERLEPARIDDVRPVYLREPDAERWRERDRGQD